MQDALQQKADEAYAADRRADLDLAIGALSKMLCWIEKYDCDPDADAGDLIEDLRALAHDHLIHLGIEEVAGQRER